MLFQAERQITHVLLTRAPLYSDRSPFALDLHVLGAPPTFALSQDQTLQLAFCDTLIFEAPNLSLSLDSEELTQEPTNLLLSVCYSVFKDRIVSTVTFVSRPALRPFVSEGARTIFRFRRPVNYFFSVRRFFLCPALAVAGSLGVSRRRRGGVYRYSWGPARRNFGPCTFL